MFLFIATNSILFASCNSQINTRDKDSLSFTKFPKEQNINFTNELRIPRAFIIKMLMLNNKLILTNFGENEMYIFNVYNTETRKVENNFVFKGTKKDESLAPVSSGLINNETIWLHDITLNKIVQYKIPQKQYDSVPFVYHKLSNHFYNIQLIDSNRSYGFSGYHGKDKIQEIDLYNRTDKDLYGVFDNKPNNFPNASWKLANEGFIYLKPTKDKFVFASRRTDKFYIMDTLTKNSFMVKGPHQIKLNVDPAHINGMDVVIPNKKTKLAYINGYCTNEYIYLLYTKSNEMDLKSDRGDEVYVFDWNGKPISRLVLNCHISSLAVSSDNKKIFAFNPDNQSIVKTNINL